MAVHINLYPPILDTYSPAFTVDSLTESKNICKIYFSLSKYNDLSMIKNAQVTVRSQYTNTSVLNETKYPSEILLTSVKEDNSRMSDDKYYIEIYPSDIQGGAFQINQYYKVQIRFTSTDAGDVALTTPQAIDTWLTANLNYFSEWSTVCLVRGISEPILSIAGFDYSTGTVSWSLAHTNIIGKLTFKDEDEKEQLKSYQIKLYNSDNDLLTDSGLLYTSSYNDVNSFTYALSYNLEVDEEYHFTIEFTTLDLYTELNTYNFTVVQESMEELDASLNLTTDRENARIKITLKNAADAEPLDGQVVIRRSSSETNFTIWEDIFFKQYSNATAVKDTFYDTTIKSGVFYKYYVQKVNEKGERGLIKMAKNPVMIVFDDMFLTSKDKQLKIKFNPTVSSYKRTIQESRTDTLGSQFPYIRRNGYANYAQFPIGGLISFYIDENELFTSNKELFGDSLSLYNNYNKNELENTIFEKAFKDKVIEYLYDGEVKLFRSATEGNFLVKVMDVSLSPQVPLGRKLWSFTGTAYEVAEYNAENLIKYNILEGNDE